MKVYSVAFLESFEMLYEHPSSGAVKLLEYHVPVSICFLSYP